MCIYTHYPSQFRDAGRATENKFGTAANAACHGFASPGIGKMINHKATNALCMRRAQFNNVTAGGAYSYHGAVKGLLSLPSYRCIIAHCGQAAGASALTIHRPEL